MAQNEEITKMGAIMKFIFELSVFSLVMFSFMYLLVLLSYVINNTGLLIVLLCIVLSLLYLR